GFDTMQIVVGIRLMRRVYNDPSFRNMTNAEYVIQPTDETESVGPTSDTSLLSNNVHDVLMSNAGLGRFHIWLTIVCGLANASDAIEVICVSFLLPSAECALSLDATKKGYLNASIFIGMLIGGYIWSIIADTFGRRSTLITSLIVNAIFGGVSSIAPSYGLFISCRFLSGIGYYILWMWLPELYDRFEQSDGQKSVCSLKKHNLTNGSSIIHCKPATNVFINSFITSTANLPGNILTIIFIDRFGRKLFLGSSLLLSGISVFLILFIKTRLEIILLMCLFSSVSSIAFNALDCIGTEMFPQNIRSSAIGLGTVFSRLAAIIGNILFVNNLSPTMVKNYADTFDDTNPNNDELKELCLLFDNERKNMHQLAEKYKQFGHSVVEEMGQKIAVYQTKLSELEIRQTKLIQENEYLKNIVNRIPNKDFQKKCDVSTQTPYKHHVNFSDTITPIELNDKTIYDRLTHSTELLSETNCKHKLFKNLSTSDHDDPLQQQVSLQNMADAIK
ncbi:unnamed protein product, partial [Didymodactylos carnosus]